MTRTFYSQEQVDEIYEALRFEYASPYPDNPADTGAAKKLMTAALNGGETTPDELHEKIMQVKAKLDKPMYMNRFSQQILTKFWKLNLDDGGSMIRPLKFNPITGDTE